MEVFLFYYRHRGFESLLKTAVELLHLHKSQGDWKDSRMANSPPCPYIPFTRVSCLSSKSLFVLICPHTYQLLTTWVVSASRCLKIRFQCQLRHIPDKNNWAFTSRQYSLPVKTQWLNPKRSLLNNAEIQACTSSAFFLHQQMYFFPHNSWAVSNYGECLWSKGGGEVKPLCALLLLEHMDDWIPENSNNKNGVTLAVSQRRNVPWMNFLFQSATDIGFLQPGHTQEVSHTYSPVVCRLQTLPALEWQAVVWTKLASETLISYNSII